MAVRESKCLERVNAQVAFAVPGCAAVVRQRGRDILWDFGDLRVPRITLHSQAMGDGYRLLLRTVHSGYSQ